MKFVAGEAGRRAGATQRTGTLPGLAILPLESADPKLDGLYRDVLAPSFPEDELCSFPELQQIMTSGIARSWVAVDAQGDIVGGLVGEWDAGPRVMLLSWLATRPGTRSAGVGGALLESAIEAWRTEFDPCLVLSEVEDPGHYRTADEAYGDPAARLRFYLKHRARPLDLPYFQAALGEKKQRVRGLFLIVLHAHPSFAGAQPDTIDGAVLREYFETYQLQCEGAVATDDEAMRLWDAIDRPGGVPFRSAGRP